MEENIKEEDALEMQRAEYEAKIARLKRDFALEKELMRAGARNIKACRALIDEELISLDEGGELTGFKEQLEGLKAGKETAFLFEKEMQFEGLVPCEESGIAKGEENMTYAQLCEIYSN